MVVYKPEVCGKEGLGTAEKVPAFDSIKSGLVLDNKNVRGRKMGEKREGFTPTARKSVVASISPARLSMYR